MKQVLRKPSVWHSGDMVKPEQAVCSCWIEPCTLKHFCVSNPVEPSYPKYSPLARLMEHLRTMWLLFQAVSNLTTI